MSYPNYPPNYRTQYSTNSSSNQQAYYASYPSPIAVRSPNPNYYASSPASSYGSSSYSASPTSPYLASPSSSTCCPQVASSQQPAEYHCLWQNCTYSCARYADLQRHSNNTHNREFASLVDCDYPGCTRKGVYGFTRKDKMVEHMRDVHKVDIPKRGGGGKRS